MIRVLLRHMDEEAGTLLGDFPPSEMGDLLEALRLGSIRNDLQGASSDTMEFFDPIGPNKNGSWEHALQWIWTPAGMGRWVLEVVLQDSP